MEKKEMVHIFLFIFKVKLNGIFIGGKATRDLCYLKK